jgi:hypothetical protein
MDVVFGTHTFERLHCSDSRSGGHGYPLIARPTSLSRTPCCVTATPLWQRSHNRDPHRRQADGLWPDQQDSRPVTSGPNSSDATSYEIPLGHWSIPLDGHEIPVANAARVTRRRCPTERVLTVSPCGPHRFAFGWLTRQAAGCIRCLPAYCSPVRFPPRASAQTPLLRDVGSRRCVPQRSVSRSVACQLASISHTARHRTAHLPSTVRRTQPTLPSCHCKCAETNAGQR